MVDFSEPTTLITIIAVALFGLIYLFKPKKERHDMNHPGKKELHKIYKDGLEEITKFLGASLKSDLWYNAYPILAIKRVAYIQRTMNQHEMDEWESLTEKERNSLIKQGIDAPTPIVKPYLVLKGCRPSFIDEILLYPLGVGTIRMLVEVDQVEKRYHTFYLKEGLTPRTFGKVWLVDKRGKALLEDIAWKWEVEDILEQQINFSKRVSFLAPQLGSSIARAEATAEIEKSKWESHKKAKFT